MIKRVAFFAHAAKDVKRAAQFYTELLGLTSPSFYENVWGEVETPEGATIAFDTFTPGPYLALETDDIQKEIAHLREHGVEIVKDIWDCGACWMCLIKDCEGNILMIHQMYPGRE